MPTSCSDKLPAILSDILETVISPSEKQVSCTCFVATARENFVERDILKNQEKKITCLKFNFCFQQLSEGFSTKKQQIFDRGILKLHRNLIKLNFYY